MHTLESNLQADVLLVTVTKREAEAVLHAVEKRTGNAPTQKSIGSRIYHDLGVINDAKVFMVQSEMGAGGLGAAQQTVQRGIAALNPSAVIMVGIAFGMNSDSQRLGDILVSQRLMLYELQRIETKEDGSPRIIRRGSRPDASVRLLNRFRAADLCKTRTPPTVYFGTVLSGEKLIDNIDFRRSLRELEPEAIGGEMEGAGLYAACEEAHVDWILVKAICDWADGQKELAADVAQPLAAQNAATFVLNALEMAPLKRDDASSRTGPASGDVQTLSVTPLLAPILDHPVPISRPGPLRVLRILEGYSKAGEVRIFDVTIANASDVQLILATFDVTWRYHVGRLRSIASGSLLKPLAQYVIKLPIDTDDELMRSRPTVLYPPIVVPPKTDAGSALATVRIQVEYFFDGRLDFHPCADWNIVFNIDILTTTNERCSIFSDFGWRGTEHERMRTVHEREDE